MEEEEDSELPPPPSPPEDDEACRDLLISISPSSPFLIVMTVLGDGRTVVTA